MQSRHRTRMSTYQSGRIYRRSPLSVTGPFVYQQRSWVCDDFIKKKKSILTGRTPPSQLSLIKTEIQPVFLDYTHYNGKTLENQYTKVPCYAPGTTLTAPLLGWEFYEGTETELIAKLLARTNPFAYSISVPVLIAELIDAASLLKVVSNNFISLVGSGYLNWKFGWEATIMDIKTLAGITKEVEDRIRQFNALLTKGGITRRVRLASGGSSTATTETSIYSSGLGEWRGRVQTSHKTKVWGSVRWVPNRLEPVEIERLTTFNEALRVVLDLRKPDWSTLWEATPWSWLVDYFLNVGDVLQAIESSDLVVPTEICLMRKRTVSTTCDLSYGPPSGGTNYKTSKGTPGLVEHTIKLRSVPPAQAYSQLLSFGFMSKRQATNLLALIGSLQKYRIRWH